MIGRVLNATMALLDLFVEDANEVEFGFCSSFWTSLVDLDAALRSSVVVPEALAFELCLGTIYVCYFTPGVVS